MTILALAESPELVISLLLLCSAISSIFYTGRARSLGDRALASRRDSTPGDPRSKRSR